MSNYNSHQSNQDHMKHMPSATFTASDSDSYQCTSKQDEMILAAQSGDVDQVEHCLDDEEVNVNEKGNCFRTALENACVKGHVDVVKLLLDRGAKLEYHYLIAACMRGHHLVVDHLLKMQNGFYVVSPNHCRQSPLHAACMMGQDGIAMMLLERGANVHASVKGNTPLHYCCLTLVRSRIFDGPLKRNLFSCIDLLVCHGADMNKENEQGETPRYLMKQWRILEENHEQKMTFLKERATHPHQETRQMIEANDDSLDEVDSVFNCDSCTESYEEEGSLNSSTSKDAVKTDDDSTATSTQKQPQDNEYASQKVDIFKGLEKESILKSTPLFVKDEASSVVIENERNSESNSSIKLLMNDRKSPAITASDQILKHEKMNDAASLGNLAKVEWLIENEAMDINGKDDIGWTALHCASYFGCDEMIMFLLSRGANLEECTTDLKLTPLMCACDNRHFEVANILLNHGANITVCDSSGSTCLHKACDHAEDGLAHLLLDRGAIVNATNNNKQTPLHLACSDGVEGLCELLLLHGADVYLKDANGDTPFDVANAGGHFNTAKLISEHKNKVLLTDIGKENQCILTEVKQIGSRLSHLDWRLHSKIHDLEQKCSRILERPQDTTSSCNEERANNSKKRGAGTQLRLRLRCSQSTKRAKLDDEKNCGVTQLLENCTEMQKQTTQKNREVQEAIEKMERKDSRNKIFLGLLAGICWMSS